MFKGLFPISSCPTQRLLVICRRCYSMRDQRSVLLDSLKRKFDIKHIQIEEPKYRVFVRHSIFHGMPMELQHKIVMELLPEEVRHDVVLETSDIPHDVDRKVNKVFLKKTVRLPPDGNVLATPQSLLDTAVFNLAEQYGSIASECLWLSASLALKSFCITHGFDPKTHTSKNRVVGYLKKSLNLIGTSFDFAWKPSDLLPKCLQGRSIVR